ncbi:hypothetical protein EMPS_01377 [Entomortierella parvispora]|uniref:Uncharacterized protein n=1 Tax=Entomortierella parvispora TaxID=205924 RepID=A0A9P3H2Q7_9FUNG|nr:hypothetical protein EMPS_01377 [Entomortierella parvispora]
MTAPFDKYEKVDLYIMDESVDNQSFMLQSDVDLSLGMTAARLEAPLFPETLPVNRSCHVLFIGQGNSLDGTHQTLNSSSFFMIRDKQTINGTLVPITLPPTATATTSATTTSQIPSTKTTTTTTTAINSTTVAVGAPATNVPSTDKSSSVLSPLVIGLISAGCAALLIAIVALGLLYRARRQYHGDTSDFKSLHDQPYSPTDGASQAPSVFKNEASQEPGSGPYSAGASVAEGSMAAGRSSSNTARSGDPMLRSAPGLLSYSNSNIGNNPYRQNRTTSTPPVPLLERKSSNLNQIPESKPIIIGDASLDGGSHLGDNPASSRQSIEPALTPGDAQLIAETFRKSMRRPRWDSEDDEEEQDESRRAAKELLRKELSEEGVDVQRGVQRRVTIKDRKNHRSSVAPPLSQPEMPQTEP